MLFARKMPIRPFCVGLLIVALPGETSPAGNWSQFRGPHGSGISTESAKLPAQIGPMKNLLWKMPLAKGHSSPVVYGKWVFLTAFRDRKLLTLALDADSGKILWERRSKYRKLESFHRIGSPATPSVATDGEVVISFFGSYGMTAYSPDGKLLWRKPMSPFNNQFGATSSPVDSERAVPRGQQHTGRW